MLTTTNLKIHWLFYIKYNEHPHLAYYVSFVSLMRGLWLNNMALKKCFIVQPARPLLFIIFIIIVELQQRDEINSRVKRERKISHSALHNK